MTESIRLQVPDRPAPLVHKIVLEQYLKTGLPVTVGAITARYGGHRKDVQERLANLIKAGAVKAVPFCHRGSRWGYVPTGLFIGCERCPCGAQFFGATCPHPLGAPDEPRQTTSAQAQSAAPADETPDSETFPQAKPEHVDSQ